MFIFFSFTILSAVICFIALELASNSTGNVTIENKTANDINPAPIHNAVEPKRYLMLLKDTSHNNDVA